jgi:hypothetical protein
MTAIITGHDGRRYLHTATERRTVFVADMPRATNGRGTPHTGHAVLVAWLEPLNPGGEPLATVRLPNGAMLPVRASAICDAATIAARRIGTAAQPARRAG